MSTFMQAFQIFLNVIPYVMVILVVSWICYHRHFHVAPKFRIVRANKTNQIHVQVSKLGILWEFVQDQGEDKAFFIAESNAYAWCDAERNRWLASKAKRQQKYTVLRELDAEHPFTEDNNGYEAR